MDTFHKYRPRGPSMKSLSFSAPHFLGGKRKKTRRKKKRKSVEEGNHVDVGVKLN